jgi:SET domain-containing protein
MAQLSKSEIQNVVIAPSSTGDGAFANRDFAAGEVILYLRGKLITCYEDDDIDDETRSNTIRYDEEYFLSPGKTPGNYINHSCAPNAKIDKRGKRLALISIVPIKKGREITFDYSTTLAADDVWTMKCKCGTSSCRKVVRRFNLLPKSLQKVYIQLGIVPQYIVNIT